MPRSNFRLMLAGLLLVLVAGGCAAAGEGGTRGSSNVLTAEEMAGAPISNLYDAVEQLRPRWFQVRSAGSLQGTGPVVGVFMNRTYQGGTEVLRSLSTSGVAQLRYLDGPAASAQLRTPGAAALAGAIIIEMETGGN
jgi:hypothetical protein